MGCEREEPGWVFELIIQKVPLEVLFICLVDVYNHQFQMHELNIFSFPFPSCSCYWLAVLPPLCKVTLLVTFIANLHSLAL